MIMKKKIIIGYTNSKNEEKRVAKELYDYFDKKVSYEEAINNIKKNTRHFIKRQYTFFNRQMDVNWIKVNFTNFDETVKDALQILKIN